MSRKEMGLAVRALGQYADDCLSGVCDYIEMVHALNVAKNLANRQKGGIGLFGNKNGIVGAALGASGAFDKNKKTDKAAAFGAAIGASIGSGKNWSFGDSMKLSITILALDSQKKR